MLKTPRPRGGKEQPAPAVHKPALPAGGQELPASTQASLGAAFGHDLSSVRVFADDAAAESAQDLGAAAYAQGSDLFFNKGFYNPDTGDGRHLLAHELTHVVQQDRFGSAGAQARKLVSEPGDAAEREAESVAGRAARGERVEVRAAPSAAVSRWSLLDTIEEKASGAWHGAQHLASGAVHGAEHLASGALHGAEHLGSSFVHGAQHAGAGLAHNLGNAWHGAQHLATQAAHGAQHMASGAWHGATGLARRVAGGAGHAWNNATHFASTAAHGLGHLVSRGLHGAEHLASGAWNGARRLGGRVMHGAEHLAAEGVHGAEHLGMAAAHGAGHLWNNARHFGASALHRGESLASRGLHGMEHLALGAVHGAEHLGSGLAHGASGLAHGAESLASRGLHGAESLASGAWDGVKNAVGPLPSLHQLGDAASEQFAPLINAKTPWEALKAEGSIAYNGMKTAGGWVKSAGEAATHGIDWAEDKASGAAHWAADQTNGIPVLSGLAHGAAGMVDMQSQLTGGLLKGATGLVEGVATMVVNPVDTLKGLEAMAEHVPGLNPLKIAHGLMNVATGQETMAELQAHLDPIASFKEDGQFWKAVGGGLIGQYSESWKQGKYADVIGHAGFDVATLFVGAGEANAVAKTAEAAKIADAAKMGEAAKIGDAANLGDAARLGDGADAARLGDGADAARAGQPAAEAAAREAAPVGDALGEPGLAERGLRPQPGQRATTREEYQAGRHSERQADFERFQAEQTDKLAGQGLSEPELRSAVRQARRRTQVRDGDVQRFHGYTDAPTGRLAEIDEKAGANHQRLLREQMGQEAFQYRYTSKRMQGIYEGAGRIDRPTFMTDSRFESNAQSMDKAQVAEDWGRHEVGMKIPTSEVMDARVPRPFGNSPHVRQGWEPHTNSYPEYGSGGALQYMGRTERYDPAWAYDLTDDFGKGKDAAESGGGAAVPAVNAPVAEAPAMADATPVAATPSAKEATTGTEAEKAEVVAKQEAQKIEAADGGHSIDRHGPEVSDAELESRIKTGVAPDGVFSPTKSSTQFAQYGDWVETRKAAMDEISASESVDLTNPPKPGDATEYRKTVDHGRPLGKGRVADASSRVRGHVDPSTGKTGTIYTDTNSVDGLTRTTTTVTWDPASGRWKVTQHFPSTEGWDQATGTYTTPVP